jgi:Cft2 family RNA processing exonuclease
MPAMCWAPRLQLKITEGRKRPKIVLFSGDLGNHDKILTPDPAEPDPADVVIIEATYGDRAHRSMRDSIAELRQAILLTFARGGNVIIPSFALERSQELLWTINGFSAHADQPGLLRWLAHAHKLEKIFLVHGEMPSLVALKHAIAAKLGRTAHIADWKETVEL